MNIKLLNENAKIPTRGSAYAAGYDLYSTVDVEIRPRETVKVGTGIAIELPTGTFGGIYARSGLATKRGLRPANCCGIVDEDYRGEIIVALHNDSDITQHIPIGERIAQLIIQPYKEVNMNVVDELVSTERADKGFGSSGTN